MMISALAAAAIIAPASLFDFSVSTIDGDPKPLADYKGKVVIVVNTASKCGLTPQYEGLEALYKKHKDAGLVVLGFPANNFAGQEPGTNAEIKAFCTGTYAVSFPMFSKISVKGPDQHPLYRWLVRQVEPVADIEWNFAKFLVGKDGKVIKRFPSRTAPNSPEFTEAVSKALAATE